MKKRDYTNMTASDMVVSGIELLQSELMELWLKYQAWGSVAASTLSLDTDGEELTGSKKHKVSKEGTGMAYADS